MYSDDRGKTKIIDKMSNKLTIAYRPEDLLNNKANKIPVLLHEGIRHDAEIPLSHSEAVTLLMWLQSYLQDVTENP